jgi:hypothetical protein
MDHRCLRGAHCSEFETLDDATRVGAHIEADHGLCDTCDRHTQRGIRSLPEDYTSLNLLLGKGSTAGGEPIRMTKELPVPIRLHIEAAQRAMVREAAMWAESVAAALNSTIRPRGGARPGWMLDRACRTLSGATSTLYGLRDVKHVRWEYGRRVLVARDGYDGALTLKQLHHKARMFTGQLRLTHRLPVPCPRCDAMALEREDGSSTIDCTDCARRYTWDEYEQLCCILVDRRAAFEGAS